MIPEIHLEIINSQRVKPVEVNKPNKSYQKSFPLTWNSVLHKRKKFLDLAAKSTNTDVIAFL